MRADGGSEVEILHHVGGTRWVAPKGWPSGAWMSQAAAIEALEEQSSTLCRHHGFALWQADGSG